MGSRLVFTDEVKWRLRFGAESAAFQTVAGPICSHGLEHSGVRCLILKEPQDDLCF
jgi:hypothetical protein